jgi:acetyl esterase/lipase
MQTTAKHPSIPFLQLPRYDCSTTGDYVHRTYNSIKDALDVVRYVMAHPAIYDRNQVFVSGFSAGGSLALGVSLTLGPEEIKGCFALYPGVDSGTKYPGTSLQPQMATSCMDATD